MPFSTYIYRQEPDFTQYCWEVKQGDHTVAQGHNKNVHDAVSAAEQWVAQAMFEAEAND